MILSQSFINSKSVGGQFSQLLSAQLLVIGLHAALSSHDILMVDLFDDYMLFEYRLSLTQDFYNLDINKKPPEFYFE